MFIRKRQRRDKVSKKRGISEKGEAPDYLKEIDTLSLEKLESYISLLEERSADDERSEECLLYARERMCREEEKKARRERRAEERARKEEKERLTAEALEERKAKLLNIGNGRIRENILSEYAVLDRTLHPRLTPESRDTKLGKVRTALGNIDFVGSSIISGYYPASSVISIVYLTDRNVLLFEGIEYSDCYIYLPCIRGAKLELVSAASMRSSWFDVLQKTSRTVLPEIKHEYWTPTLSYFPAPFLRSFLSEYYLNYEERPSEGRETTNIPNYML